MPEVIGSMADPEAPEGAAKPEVKPVVDTAQESGKMVEDILSGKTAEEAPEAAPAAPEVKEMAASLLKSPEASKFIKDFVDTIEAKNLATNPEAIAQLQEKTSELLEYMPDEAAEFILKHKIHLGENLTQAKSALEAAGETVKAQPEEAPKEPKIKIKPFTPEVKPEDVSTPKTEAPKVEREWKLAPEEPTEQESDEDLPVLEDVGDPNEEVNEISMRTRLAAMPPDTKAQVLEYAQAYFRSKDNLDAVSEEEKEELRKGYRKILSQLRKKMSPEAGAFLAWNKFHTAEGAGIRDMAREVFEIDKPEVELTEAEKAEILEEMDIKKEEAAPETEPVAEVTPETTPEPIATTETAPVAAEAEPVADEAAALKQLEVEQGKKLLDKVNDVVFRVAGVLTTWKARMAAKKLTAEEQVKVEQKEKEYAEKKAAIHVLELQQEEQHALLLKIAKEFAQARKQRDALSLQLSDAEKDRHLAEMLVADMRGARKGFLANFKAELEKAA